MYYYKFRVFYDEVEDFVRDIEILSNDNFESFHKILFECIGLKGNEYASFSICDPKWNKQKEITLTDTAETGMDEDPEYEDEDTYSTKSRLPKFVMSDAVLKDFITDPHQHIMYEYDFMNPKIFYIELQKVLQAEEGVTYPRCTYKVKEMPVQFSAADVPDPVEEDIDDDDLIDDNSFDDGFNEEDTSGLNEYSEFS